MDMSLAVSLMLEHADFKMRLRQDRRQSELGREEKRFGMVPSLMRVFVGLRSLQDFSNDALP